jgi:cellulose synthase/poly-beta-1,6-N-acetylglucosamine synthase-like glycosyltransferase
MIIDLYGLGLHLLLFLALYFQVFILLTFLEKKPALREGPIELKIFPKTAIIVPCFNEEKTLKKTVYSLLNLDYPKDRLDILIVDDGSTDNTLSEARAFEVEPQVKVFHQENSGKHAALNFGLSQAKEAELVGCLDADSFVEPGTLKKIVRYFEDPEIAAVTPAIKIFEPRTLIQRVQNAEYNMGIFLRKAFGLMNAIYVAPGPFSIFRKKLLDELGGYRKAHQTEDLEIALRLQSRRYRIENCHQAFVYTVAPAGLQDLYRQRLRWTTGFLKNLLDYRAMFLNKNCGHLGLFALPSATASIFTALISAGLLVWSVVKSGLDKLAEIQILGIDSIYPRRFDWFFVNTGSALFLAATLFLITLVFLFLGHRMAQGKSGFAKDAFLFIVFYPFLAPLWMAKAVYNAALARENKWK